MTKLTESWVNAARTRAVFDALEAGGLPAYFVGGCVRNALLGKPAGDIDLATPARPEDVMRLAAKAGLKAVPTGIEHGTVTVVSDHVPFEVTTFRKDVETDGRRAVVAFADDMAEDAMRRDFTMNALFADRTGTVLDPLNGLPDLLARRVRFIDDATKRIREDYLRILRFFRFHAFYGDPDAGMDAEALDAISRNMDGLETLSAERVGAEMLKLLSAPDPAPAVAAMAHCGVLARVLPGADAKTLPVLVDMEADMAPDPIRRLAALGGPDPCERLRLSRAQARQRAELAEIASSMDGPAALGFRHGETQAASGLLLRAASLQQPLQDGWRKEVARGASATFPVKAADLMAAHSGPALGRKLKELEARWIASDFALSKADLLGNGSS